MKFTVVLHSDDGQHYGVTVPDLPGCFSFGEGIDEALLSAQEAIDLHVEGLLENGEALPAHQPVSVHQSKRRFAKGIWAVVDVPVEKYFGPAEKINITVPRAMLARIDAWAKRHGMSRSGFLVEAARSAMQS